MDWINAKDKILEFLKKYKYAVLILVLGLVLMTLPERSTQEQTSQEPTVQPETQLTTEDRLAEVLSQIQGVGKVRVLLTLSQGEETLYQTNNETVSSAESGTVRVETVIVSNADRGESGLIRQVNPPTFLGALIVCQGGDRPGVQLAVVDAVSKLTGLGSDQISVLKMK